MHVITFHDVADSFKAITSGEAQGRQAAIVFFTILIIAGLIWLLIFLLSPPHASYYINS
ncbi:MAG: hypothetical protein JSU01_17695 [Bacteroidetes bacterium]|nr:hypothetical protein [Bacteroidota bacterium]